MTELPQDPQQPEPQEQPEPPAQGLSGARFALRVSMVVMAVGVIAFAYFTPVWMDRGLTKVHRDRLQVIAADTAEQIVANGWTAAEGLDYAQRQTKLGNLATAVDISIGTTTVTVRITGTAASANPFASLTGADTINRIEVAHTTAK